jgi:aminopeptidase N
LEIACKLADELQQVYERNQADSYQLSAQAMGRRSLKNCCLSYLTGLNQPPYLALAIQQFESANNMTDQMAALKALTHTDCSERDLALARFYDRWQDEPLVIDKWFAVQASASLPDTLQRVNDLSKHDAFDMRVPNRVRALYGVFSQANPVCFHDSDGRGYVFLGDCVKSLNALNPQIAARLALPLIQWKRFDDRRQELMRRQLQSISEMPDIAKDLYEIVNRGLH